MDILKIAGLAPKKKSEKDKYATFHRRMLAAALDSFLILLFVAPVIDWLFATIYGPVPIDWTALGDAMNREPDQQAANALFWQTLYDSGFVKRWLINGVWQFIVLGAVTGICWRKWSATPGKMLLRIKVVDAKTEGPISNRQILLRLLGYAVSTAFFLAGFFWIGLDKRRQGWHDKLAGTVVIVRPRLKRDSLIAGPSDSPGPSAAE
jgi:uncharacterized RDD family membrane protein YckC